MRTNSMERNQFVKFNWIARTQVARKRPVRKDAVKTGLQLWNKSSCAIGARQEAAQGTLTEDEFPVNPEQQKKKRILTLRLGSRKANNSLNSKEFFYGYKFEYMDYENTGENSETQTCDSRTRRDEKHALSAGFDFLAANTRA